MANPPFAAGDLVHARGDRWIVEEAVQFSDCTMLRLSATDVRRRREACSLLYPFDRPKRQELQPAVRSFRPRRWMRFVEGEIGGRLRVDQLRSAPGAEIEILAFQLEPALAVARGLASRVLLSDEVGLGKTVQAGLILAELRQRGWCDRALILTPAGLREQWVDELGRRFHIHAALIDAVSLQSMVSAIPFGLNPWSIEPVSIASIDFIKQPEVFQGAASLVWDLLIVDEAHQAAVAPQRLSTVSRLASNSRHVVLVTATPHAGDAGAYQSLCSLGTLGDDDPLAVFRRTRREVGLGGARHVRLLPVAPSADEREMHALVGDYADLLWHAGTGHEEPTLQLLAMILSKRAFSSAWSLALSIQRRINLLGAAAPLETQRGLPFDADDDPADTDRSIAAPALERPLDEQQMLERILAAATRASAAETKIAALGRLLRRVREPAIVFTEYRDTLATLERAPLASRNTVYLHGGLSRHERTAVVHAFTSGAADLLLATDAGSEGLNLQRTCRFVINLELPWNPVRLEQRIGRVDRLGQRRTVHAIHLLARDTAEATILARLLRRVGTIRTEAEIALEVIHDFQAVARRGR